MPIESGACIIPLPRMRESPFVSVDPVMQKGPDTVTTRWAHDSFGCVKLTQCKERTLQRWKNQGKSVLSSLCWTTVSNEWVNEGSYRERQLNRCVYVKEYRLKRGPGLCRFQQTDVLLYSCLTAGLLTRQLWQGSRCRTYE